MITARLIPANSIEFSFLLGGSGQDTIYGSAAKAHRRRNEWRYHLSPKNWPTDRGDGCSKAVNGGTKTVVFQDTPGTANTISFVYTSSNTPGVLGLTIDSMPVSMTNISNIPSFGVDLLGTSDTVTMDFTQKPTQSIQIDCGSGTDTINETGVMPIAQAAAVTINGGSGSELVEIGQ